MSEPIVTGETSEHTEVEVHLTGSGLLLDWQVLDESVVLIRREGSLWVMQEAEREPGSGVGQEVRAELAREALDLLLGDGESFDEDEDLIVLGGLVEDAWAARLMLERG